MSETKKPKAWQRKSTLVLAGVVFALAVFGTTTQTWVHVKLSAGVVKQADLNIVGSKAATAVTALALVALAGSLAASIAGRVARVVVTVLVSMAAIGIIFSSAAVIANPQGAAAGPVGTATGVTGTPTDASVTLFPALAVAAGVLLLLASLLMGISGRKWGQRASKFDRAAPGVQAAQPHPASEGEASVATAAQEPDDDIARWDALSRGTDPTD